MASMNVDQLPTHDTMVANIVAEYRRATPAEIQAGTVWYSEAKTWCEQFALVTGLQLETVAAVVAMTSPKNTWSENKNRATRVLKAHLDGKAIPSVHFGAVMKKIARVLNGENPYDVLKGPKETPFFYNIMGHVDYITVDRWAFLTATDVRIDDKKGGIGRAVSRLIQAAYRAAADLLRIPASVLQAICWVVRRGSAV